MQLVIRSMCSELLKIFCHTKYIVLLVIEIIITTFYMLFMTQGNFLVFSRAIDYPNAVYSVLEVLLGVALPFTIFMLVTDLFSHEFENLSIKAVFLRPISRMKIFISKILAIFVFLFMNLMIAFFIGAFVKILFKGASIGVFSILNLLFAYLISLLPMLAMILFSVFIAVLINNSSLTMFLTLILYVALRAAAIFSIKIGAVFFTTHLNYYKMCFGNINFSSVLNIALLLISYSVLFFIGAFIIFDKKEV